MAGKYWFANHPSGRLLAGSKTHDWSDVGAAAEETTTVTVTGAALGDMVVGCSHSAAVTQGTPIFDAYVSAADTVTVSVTNTDGSDALNMASGTTRVIVLPSAAVDDIVSKM